jgi:Helix-turn-helix domain
VTPVENSDLSFVSRSPVDFFKWTRAVRDAPTSVLPGKVKGTLLILATYADTDGRGAFPSMETLGEKLGKTDRSIRADLAHADEAGFLLRRRRNRQKTYRYRLTVPISRPEADVRSDSPTGSGLPLATGSELPDTSPEDLPRDRPVGPVVEEEAASPF